MIEWSYVAEYLEEHKGEIDPYEAKYWLERHRHMIDWKQFKDWSIEVRGKEGYEWLDEVFRMWQEDREERREWKED